MAIRILALILLLSVSGFYAYDLSENRVAASGLPALDVVPARVGEWRSRNIEMTEEVQEVLRADTWLYREYERPPADRASLFVAYFANQEVGAQIHSPRNCLPGSGWTIQSITPVVLQVPGGTQKANRMEIARNEWRWEVLYWFETRGGTVTGEYALKWDLVRNSLAGRPTDAAFIRFMAPVPDSASTRRLIAGLHEPVLEALAGVGLR